MSNGPITKKFSIMIVMGCEVIHYEVISERKFKHKLDEMRSLVLKTSGSKSPITLRERTSRDSGVTCTRYTFASGNSYIELHSQICDKGYHFVK